MVRLSFGNSARDSRAFLIVSLADSVTSNLPRSKKPASQSMAYTRSVGMSIFSSGWNDKSDLPLAEIL